MIHFYKDEDKKETKNEKKEPDYLPQRHTISDPMLQNRCYNGVPLFAAVMQQRMF